MSPTEGNAAQPTPDELEAARMAEDFEGWSASVYLDKLAVPHVWTIGFGSTHWFDGSPVTGRTRAITKEEGARLAALELHDALTEIQGDVRVPLTVDERAALEDFIYNIGRGAFRSSTLLRKLNAGDTQGAADEFLRWNMAGGTVLAGLARRRAAERAEFLSVAPGVSQAPAVVPVARPATAKDTPGAADLLMEAEMNQFHDSGS